MNDDILPIMTRSPVIPVIVIQDSCHAVPLAQALFRGGLEVLEITLRTKHGLQAIADVQQALPDACVGAGTVTRPQDIEDVVAVGAKFMVSPGSTDALISAALKQDIPLLPGVATPSEAMRLRERGFHQMKFFPAEVAGGVKMLKSMHGPLPDITFCPTGGITAESAIDYLTLPNVACVGGSWMVPQTLIDACDWDRIEALAAKAAESLRHFLTDSN